MKVTVVMSTMLLFIAAAMPLHTGHCYTADRRSPDKNMLPGGEPLRLTTGLTIRKQVDVSAPVSEVWKAWTTIPGVKNFFAPDARIELAIGGCYEILFNPEAPEGQRGSEGCVILSFNPEEMLSFTWNAPPSIPDIRGKRTWVILSFEAIGGETTRILMTHLGWGPGEEWQKALRYFVRAWDVVLGRLAYRFQTGPIDWKNPFTPEPTSPSSRIP